MPHIVSLPVGYMDILEKKVSFSVCSERWGLLFLQKMVITPATKIMTLEMMMTMPWWRASRTKPGETILIFNEQICIKDIWKQFICKNIISRLIWMTSCLPPSQYFFFYSQVKGNHHQQETTLEQRPPLRKSHWERLHWQCPFLDPLQLTSMLGFEIKGSDIWISRRPSCINWWRGYSTIF